MGGGDQSSNATTLNHDNHTASADWAQMLDAATQRRTEVLMPENLENMWTRGRNYGRKNHKNAKSGSTSKYSSADQSLFDRHIAHHETSTIKPGGTHAYPLHTVGSDTILYDVSTTMPECSADHDKDLSFEADHQVDEVSDIKDLGSNKHKLPLKRIASSSVVGTHPHKGGLNASEFHAPEFKKNEGLRGKSSSDMVIKKEGQGVPKLRCRVCTLDYKSCVLRNLEKHSNLIYEI
jgi:sorting nexin-13